MKSFRDLEVEFYFQKETTSLLIKQTATRGAQFVPIGIPTIFLYNFETNMLFKR